MVEKSLMIDLDDPRTNEIADVLTNATCKKILHAISDKALSVTELSQKLSIPLNTADYNVKKLVKAGLIVSSRNVLWSVKGKRVPTYQVAHQRIVISPRTGLKGLIPAVLLSGLAALGIRSWLSSRPAENILAETSSKMADAASFAAQAPLAPSLEGISYPVVGDIHTWLWFFFGALFCMVIFIAWNWRKIW